MPGVRRLASVLVVTVLTGGLGGRAFGREPPDSPPAAPGPRGNPPGGTTFSPTAKLAPLPAPETVGGATVTLEHVLAEMDRVTPVLRDLRDKLDRRQFDLDTLDEELGYDPTAIAEFVRTQIAYEPYAGVLRGELGTLIGRAGNAFDKALLLRYLLENDGYETRLVRTTLSESQARVLVGQLALPRAAAPPIADEVTLADVRRRLRGPDGTPPAGAGDAATPDEYAVARDLIAGDTALILEGLAHAGVKLGRDGVMDDLVEEARDYLWVQYRLGSFDKWIDAHPAFAGAAPTGLAVERFYRDVLPDDLHHRFRLTVTVEQKLGDRLVAMPLVSGWERRSADLAGHPVTLQMQPNNLDLEHAVDLATVLEKAALFVTSVDGKLADRGFDLKGATYAVSLLSLGAIGAAQAGGSSGATAGEAAGILGGSGVEPPADYRTLTAAWIDYTLVAPGGNGNGNGKETTTRRYILDRVGEANRSRGVAAITDRTPLLEAVKALLTTRTIMVLPGEYTPAYVSHRAVERTLTESKIRIYITPDGGLTEFPVDDLRALIPMTDVVLSGAFAVAVVPGGGTVAYRAEPALVVFEQGLRPGRAEETAYEMVDVIHNARRVFSVNGGTVAPAPQEAVRIGAWETLAERSAVRQGAPPYGTLEAMRGALAAGIPLRVLRPGDGETLKGLTHSVATVASVRRDMDTGYVVIVPERPEDASAPTGWWRVNPATGETLGITTGGYGATAAEYIFSISIIALPVSLLVGYSLPGLGCRVARALAWAGPQLGVPIGLSRDRAGLRCAKAK